MIYRLLLTFIIPLFLSTCQISPSSSCGNLNFTVINKTQTKVTIDIDAVLCDGNGQKVKKSVNISAGESIKQSVSGTGGILMAYVHLRCPGGNYCDSYIVNFGDYNYITLNVIYDGTHYYFESEP